ncbi:hypothetical protein ACIP5Y_21430 [Nocardia sp. NPDC088792]|uniref:hypothetical protein n=1 Tax=Nocardia sp. NPDC088792 TaxID=3364332 RepID=UPI003829E739
MSTNVLLATTMTPQTLNSGYLSTSDAAVYTCPASSTARINTAVLCNVTSSTVTVYVGVVTSGGSAGASHHVVHGFSLAANDTLSLTPYLSGTMLTAGDAISGYAGTASAVVMVLTGTVSS